MTNKFDDEGKFPKLIFNFQKHPLIDKQTRLICQGELKNNRGQV